MFQDFALFPHMNVHKNVAFGLRFHKLEKGKINERVYEVLDLVGLLGFEKRDIDTLSGGEQQRVALARSIAPEPRLLMLDEPLGSLDRNLRERLIIELREILISLRQTAIYVTHDQEEAFSIADRVVLMRSGLVEQIGTPQDIYRHPISPFIARFLEFSNLFPGKVVHHGNVTLISSDIGEFPIDDTYQGEVTVLIRPDRAILDSNEPITLEGMIIEKSFRGSLQRVTLKVNNNMLKFDFPSTVQLPDEGKILSIGINPQESIQVFQENR